jgi:hypothetical protein
MRIQANSDSAPSPARSCKCGDGNPDCTGLLASASGTGEAGARGVRSHGRPQPTNFKSLSVSAIGMPAGPGASVGKSLWRSAAWIPAQPLPSGDRIHSVIRNTGSTRPAGLLFHRFFCGCRRHQFWLCFGDHFGPESQVPRAANARGRAPPLAELQAGRCNRG